MSTKGFAGFAILFLVLGVWRLYTGPTWMGIAWLIAAIAYILFAYDAHKEVTK